MNQAKWPGLVGVVGAGQMGAGIAQVALQAGCRVVLVDANAEALARGHARVAAGLSKAADKGQLTEAAAAAVARLVTAGDATSLADCELVVEAVPEDLELKRDVLAAVSAVVADDAIIATNTSSLPISDLATAVANPKRFIGMHFFNPVPVLPLVELIPHGQTSAETLAIVRDFATLRLGKQAVVSKDRSGFIVNALLIPYICSAIRLLENEVASASDIDTAMVAGCAHPMGPLALADLIGLDTVSAIADTLARELGDDSLAPPTSLRDKVARGELGRKSGIGFHDYRGNA